METNTNKPETYIYFMGIVNTLKKYDFNRPEQNSPEHFLWKLIRVYKDAFFEKRYNLAIERLYDLAFWVEHMQSKQAQAVMSNPPGGASSLREFEEIYAGIPVDDEDSKIRRQQLVMNNAERRKRFEMLCKRAKNIASVQLTPNRRSSSYQTTPSSTPNRVMSRRATVPVADVVSNSEHVQESPRTIVTRMKSVAPPLSPLVESESPETLVARMHGDERSDSPVVFVPPQHTAPRAFTAASPHHRRSFVRPSPFRDGCTPPITPKTPMPSPSLDAKALATHDRKTQTGISRKRLSSETSNTSAEEEVARVIKKRRVSTRKPNPKGMVFIKTGTVLTCAWGDIKYLKNKYQLRKDNTFGPVKHDTYNNEDIKLLWSCLCDEIKEKCRKAVTRGPKKIECNTIDYTKKAIKIVQNKLNRIGFTPYEQTNYVVPDDEINIVSDKVTETSGVVTDNVTETNSLFDAIDSIVNSPPNSSVGIAETEPVSVDIGPMSIETGQDSVVPSAATEGSVVDEPTNEPSVYMPLSLQTLCHNVLRS
ncbi:hypothetical protein [Epinotia aporema granulovirus]|uniref:Uncharacterized protein n=1 Tax=Epinotia aporema granulovirus TaxID=166056 RepID=K4EQD6_9BBAC|nr:hypothetical protein [Epinotia aporema granulovirus]AER41443.1 hypothetical protein [Epinotia aporema granulovirus]